MTPLTSRPPMVLKMPQYSCKAEYYRIVPLPDLSTVYQVSKHYSEGISPFVNRDRAGIGVATFIQTVISREIT